MRSEARHHVYFNLHRSCWSIRLRGKVQRHAGALFVVSPHVDEPVRFVVRPGGRARVLREGRKNVHAFVVGNAGSWVPTPREVAHDLAMGWQGEAWVEVTYRPTMGPTFVRKDTGEAVHEADFVLMTADRKVYAIRPRSTSGSAARNSETCMPSSRRTFASSLAKPCSSRASVRHSTPTGSPRQTSGTTANALCAVMGALLGFMIGLCVMEQIALHEFNDYLRDRGLDCPIHDCGEE